MSAGIRLVRIFTDGAAPAIGGHGAWGAVVSVEGELDRECSGAIPFATNQTAELTAIYNGIGIARKLYGDTAQYVVVSDSQYCINVLTGKWGVKANAGIIECIQEAMCGLSIEFQWVRGHNGNAGNELADRLAAKAKVKYETTRQSQPKKAVEHGPT